MPPRDRSGPPGLSPAAAVRSLDLLMERVGATAREAGARFPLYARPGEAWVATRRGSWTGGFWAGLLWLRALRSQRGADADLAGVVTARLRPWARADTAVRGLIFWYPLVVARAVGGPGLVAVEEAAGAAARALAADFDPALGAVPWGAAFGGDRGLLRVDGAPGVAPLLARGGGAGAAAGVAHVRRHLDVCWAGGAVTPARRWTRAGWEPCPVPPRGWSRARPWLLLALAEAAAFAPELTGHPVVRAVLDSSAPLVPPADAARPGGVSDTSAAAIEAAALLALAARTGPDASSRLRGRADAVLRELVEGRLGDGVRGPVGVLGGGCYDSAAGVAVDSELVWGSFFLALALAIRGGVLPVPRV